MPTVGGGGAGKSAEDLESLSKLVEDLLEAVVQILNDPDFLNLVPKKYRFLLEIVAKIAKVIAKILEEA